MFNKDNLLFKTNYIRTGSFQDALQKFDLPSNAAFKVFPRRKVWGSSDGGGYQGWQGGEYDLYETGRIIDTEAFVAQAFQKKHTMIFKEGYQLMCKNQANLRYIKRRLSEIEYVTNFRFTKFLKEIAFNLLAFHNCFILKVRKKNASSGNPRKWKGLGREISPVAGYFVLPPESVEIKCDKYGTVEAYRQNMRGYLLEFDPKDVVHLSFNKRTGFTVACPPLEAVKDDILALRKIEESVESLIYKVLFPIIHVKVGTEKAPARVLQDGVSEVAIATQLLQTLDDMGGVATSERVEIAAIGAESQALRVESYLKYFKQRVYSGLGMSGVDFGDVEGSGQAAGDVVTAALKCAIAAYQDEIEDMMTKDIFDELLLESGKYEHAFEISEEDRVFLKFNEVDVDNKIKKESHTINKVASDIMTTDEARSELRHGPLKDDDVENLHSVRIQKAHDERTLKHDKERAKHEASLVPPSETTSVTKKAANGSSKTTKVTKTGVSKGQPAKKDGAKSAAKAKARPKNQYSKDWLTTRLFLVVNNHGIEDKEFQLARLFGDYLLFQGSSGLADPEEDSALSISDVKEKAYAFSKEILKNLEDLKGQGISHPVLLNKKKDLLVSKTIDKAEHYVNNIVYG